MLIGAFAVYAIYIDQTVYTTEQLVIIPGKVTSETWLGMESVLSQDISEYSLYQDFTEKNSAYISELGLFSAQKSENAPSATEPNEVLVEPTEGNSASTSTGEGEVGIGSEASLNPVNPQSIEAESNILPESQPKPVGEPEPISVSGDTQSLVWGVFTDTNKRYTLAQAIINEDVIPAELEALNESIATPALLGVNVENNVTAEENSQPVTEVSEVTKLPKEETLITAASETNSSTTVEVGTTTLESESNAPSEPAEPGVIIDTSNDYVMAPCEVEAGCSTHSMLFSDFLLPDFESGTVLNSIQLRLSLAAKTKISVGDKPQRFLIEYTYDTSTSAPAWVTASVLDIEDEISNSINGGYFLLSLLAPPRAGEIANLQIKITYQGDVSELQTAYVEGMWLEVTSGKFYEEGAGEEFTDALTYGRDLLAPELNTLNNADLDPTLGTLPQFTLSYDPQQGFFNRIFRTLFSENTFVVERITLKDSNSETVSVPFSIEYHDDKTWTMKAEQMPQKLRPGKYLVSVEILENDERYTDTFEFYWGVLAVNTKKSMYFPRENVQLNLAALTDKGDTICNANLELKIIDPKNNIFEVPVEQSGACGPNNVTDVPDYLASFASTGEWGVYTIQLQHKNDMGEIVHKITDSFEVRDYIPFDIERTAPTRIYPPAPYDVSLTVKAYRDFTGDINERVPRGFIIAGLENAVISTLPEYTLITWRDVSMKEGDERIFSYNFDAPDISPYMYLLGPLDMDGFSELRQWQIASDALNNIGWFTGTRTVAGTNLNNVASPMQWSTSSIDNYYYTHSTSSNSERITLRQTGDYLVAVNLPQQRTDINVSRTRGAIEVRKNGVAVPMGLGRSGYITGGNGTVHSESSSNVSFLMNDVTANDYIEIFVENLNTIDAGDVINVSGQASLYLEYIRETETVFAATTTRTVNSTDLNQLTASALQWIETRQDTGFVHSNTITPQNITLSATGTYMVHINVPITGVGHTLQQNIAGRVLLDGTVVNGGHFQQGYMETAATESDGDASIHWSGIIVATTTNQILTVTTARETAGVATTTVTPGFSGSIFIQKLPTAGVIALAGKTLVGGTGNNWNSVTASSTRFTSQLAYDSGAYTHSTSTNNHQITVNASGDYILNFTDSVTSAVANVNNRVTVTVGGTTVSGAQTKSNFIRNLNGHTDASTNLVFLLAGVTAGQIVTVNTQQEAAAGTVSSTTDAIIMLWKKASLDLRAPSPAVFATPFDNVRMASTTPYFDFQSNDPDGSSDIQYEFLISTSSDFATATIRVSGTNPGFTNTASTSDASPFIEGNRIRFQLQSGDSLSDLTTYYWKVRARDVSGSGEYGDYSTTQSLSINAADSTPNWYQHLSGQFKTDTLIGAVSAGANNNVTVDAAVSTEILVGYGDGTSNTPKYRLWTGANWGSEFSAVAVGGTINWVRTAAAVSRDEYMMLTIDQTNAAYAQVYSASSTTWGNRTLLSGAVANNTTNGLAVGYESLSGDAIAISCDNNKDPVYRIWNGSSWSATSTIIVSLVGVCNYLEIASDPASDEMILVVRDSLTQYQALVWNGSAWVANQVVGTGNAAQPGRSGIGLRYESSGDQAVIAVTNGSLSSIIYTTWNGTSFTTNTTQAIGDDFEFGSMASDPNSDNLVLCYIDEDADIGVLRWNGGVWSTFFELDVNGNSQVARPLDCEFETVAGRSGNIIFMYSDTVAARYQIFNYASSTWSVEQSITGIGTSGLFWGQSERAGDGKIVSMWHDDVASGDEIESSYWNGTSFATKQSIVPNPSSIIGVPFETYSMAAKRFQFTQGIVRSTAINFNSVPNQLTWGDLSFSTTEPFGTDVRVRIRYTVTTTCDTYIPDGVLLSNSAGFGTESIPVVLTGLSTTTYSQICLEATISTLGSASASLDEWTVSWLRKPKLIQNAYRWYDNGSFLTPTDPWPSGVTDVSENSPLTSAESVNVNDVVRLRLALEGTNVVQATNTSAFKLQYSDGLSCTAATGWKDVGAVSSTTALWRGYANAIVGSDWYNAAWTRRSKISIEGTLVSGAQTNFPVYVNLDDLPDSFFANVQTDGDDIRVTTNDGLTEVPFELVSIDTIAKIGELHFKATLASTTDTDFYIYYSNAGVSGYAVTATYGRNNVWTNGYQAVYHMGTNPSSPIVDSTSNGRNITASGGMGAGNSTSSQLGLGLSFDGVDDRLTNGGFAWSSTPVTVTTWNNVATAQIQTSNLFGFNIAPAAERFASHAPWSDSTIYWDYGSCCSAPGRISASYAAYRDKWTHIGLVSEGGTGAFMGIYLDGALITSIAASDNPNATLTGFALGSADTAGGAHHRGRIDEFRIASVARSAGWLATERLNQSNPTGFYALAAEELIGDGALLPSKLLTNSDYAETYEESNPTAINRFAIPVGNASEWDFVLQNNAATANTNYCFRMVYADGSTLNTYTQYPQLITNAPPPAPILAAPFDNEQLASTSPWFEFSADDEVSDEVSYEIMVDADVNFGSPDITNESNANFALFTNLSSPSERGLYTSGQIIRFISPTSLTNGSTYWWRVRAKDDNGSGTYGEWSVPSSFTVNSATAITTWFQTTGDQFNTNTLLDAFASTSTGEVGIDTLFTNATVTSSGIDFDDRDLGNAWGAFSFTQNVTAGTIRHFIEYRTVGESFALIPDSVIPGNSSGFTSSPVTLTALDTNLYNELRIVSVLSGTPTLPRLQSVTVIWAQTIDAPIHVTPFNNAKVATTSPAFTFSGADPQSDSLEYEFQYSSDYAFTASSTFNSSSNPGFVNTASTSDVTPFNSNDTVRYTVQTALINGNTYWWRVRARDPLGSNSYSNYSTPESFTVDTSILVSVWHQTTGEQFTTNTTQDIETTVGGAQITSVVSGVMAAYGEGTGQAPQYRLWNGAAWSTAASADTVGAQIRWTQLKAAPTRPEYALATLGTDLDINIQIYDVISESWGNMYEIYTEAVDSLKRRFDIEYETTSGDLLAVSCVGTEAKYSIWNGTSWSASTTINLANANNCEWVRLTADPVSDEIIALFRHVNTGAFDYEALVWNGSSFGNSLVFGNLEENAHEGMALNYEASGNQALAIVSNNTLGSYLWSAWNGSSWSVATATTIANDFEWGSLKRDVGTDNMVLCYIDDGADIGVKQWNGASWSAGTVITITGNDKRGLPADCEFQTLLGIDGDIVIPYSDTIDAKFQTYTTATGTYSGEFTMIAGININDSWRLQTVRGGDGTIHTFAFDDGSNPDRYSTSRWGGTAWSVLENFSTSPSITTAPFDGSITAAAQIYPNFTTGTILSTPIKFADGSGPRWERFTWSDTTPALSDIRYRLYYLTSSSTYAIVPDSALTSNAAGFTNSPVSIADLDRSVYSVLKMEAELICNNGTCPSIQDWSLEWSQGINVSGTAYEYNGTTTVPSGTVAVAVNGVLQLGKTAAIGGLGTWSIPNVTAFPGDAITVFIDGASDADEAIGITTYDGVGDVTQMELSKRTITFGSTDVATSTHAQFGAFDTSDDEDVFFSVTGSSSLVACGAGSCGDAKIKVKNTAIYQPGGNVTTSDFNNQGRFLPESNTIRIGGSWTSTGTFVPSLSTVIFTATTASHTITSSSTASSSIYHNVTFGETAGTASWTLSKPLDITGTLVVDYGTLIRGTSTINLEQNLRIGANGTISGLGTTTFDGSGSHTWTDSTASSIDLGYVVVNGTAKTITLGGNVTAQTITIGSDDTLNASGSGFNINVYTAWINNNSFIPQSGTVTLIGTTTGTIARGASAFNNLTFNGVGSIWSFSTSTLVVNNNFTIATGTVTLPTGTTTIAGNFTNSGGTFLHNNGEVRMTSTATGKTITQRATTFLNAFYDLVFTGSGSWSYTENAASTTRNYLIQSGTVTVPATSLTVGGDFTVSGSGVFAHNSGEIILLLQATNTVRGNGSNFNNLRTRGSGVFTRTFTDSTAVILGNLILDTGGIVTLPTGVLSIGGSFDNNATFNNSSGTVRFNSTAGAETIAMGASSTFATLEFNSATGDFTVNENATATVALNLINASQFTMQSGLTLAALGTFTTAINNANTNWTGSTLSLSGDDGAINLKSHGGDSYGTLLVNGDTDITMWNSSASTYTTISTASIYSADHAAVDGDLNIYGDYVRSTGTEFWSFATDFDGVALTGSTSRQVDVRVAASSLIGLTSASLNMVGSAAASTTIDAIAGSYSLTATTSTITANYFTVGGINANGLQLNASTTLSSFQDGFFTIAPGGTGITISSTTVNQNPAAQYSRINFATTSAGVATNVTMNGVSDTFVWFRLGIGNLYGEAFDANDGNPGSIRFDDSSNTITISGVVYADDGVTPLGAPTCDGITPNVRVIVNNGTYSASTTCAAGTGAFSLTGVAYVGDPKITVYLNTNGGTVGTVVTKTPTANISNLDIYANRVIARHQDVTPLSIADMVLFDNDDDSDIRFSATTTGSATLGVLPGNSLFIFASTTFAPGGNVTLFGNASTSVTEGTLQLGVNATFTATGTETHTLSGRLVLATTSALTAASSTFVFNATTTGKSITSPNTVTFNNLQFTGVGGGLHITAPLIINGNMTVATGTVTGTSNVTLTNGSLSGDGTLSFGSGTTTLNRANTFGGTRAWLFNNLVVGSGSVVGTTTRAGIATTTILGRLTINTAHFLVAGASNWDLAGTGTVFVEMGTLVEGTSAFRYSGASSQVLATTYYNLDINAGAGTPIYTAAAIGIGVTNNLTVGGAAATVFDVNANDPALIVGGSLSIASNGTLSASNIATTSIGSNYINQGTFTSNNGIVAMIGSGASTIAPGNSSFATLVINNPLGSFTQSQNATTTAAFTLLNHANFTLASGTTMAIGGTFTNTLGGAATTFSTSTISFYGGGTKTINDKSVSEVYDTLFVASSTNVKMWNSSATNYNALGGIYSQDHASVDGKLNIFGSYTQTTNTDYWSYATDFDGVSLGASSRRVDVAIASNANVVYTGGGLEVVGVSTASTTLANQGAGTYGLIISGTASTSWDMVVIRNINASGTVFTGTPTIGTFSRTDHLIAINGGTGITVGGTVIDTNQAKNFTNNIFASSTGVTGATNVTATGTTVSSWRFTNHQGALSGELYDSDPTGDPGYLVWDNSAALITVSGNVYSDEGATVSTVCNGVTQNIILRVAGLTTYTASCNAGTGAYSISNVAFSPSDTLTVYIDNNIRKAVTISADPVSSISNMNLYENRVIVRHENTSPLTIADMAIWDSSDDGDILFTATDAATDILVLPADQKLLVWNGKTFEPNGNVTLAGGGGGGAQDGTLEAQANATFRANGTEAHSIGGSMIFGAGAIYTTGLSTTTFTTTGSSRTIDVNSNPFYNVVVTGVGSYNVTDTTFTTNRSFTQSNGAVTFGSGTTTIGASLNATAGSFTMNGTALLFTSTTTGNVVRFDDSNVPRIRFQGTGGAWSMTDVHATTTGSFTIASGTVTLPSGNLAVASSFENVGGAFIDNTADLIMSASSSANIRANGSNLFAVRLTGVGPFAMTDTNITLSDTLSLATGTLTMASGTVSVGGDFLIASGTVTNATGTVLFNATSVGKTVQFGNNALYNVVFGSGTGGWNFISNATTTNNFSITGANTFTKEANTQLNIGGVFTNIVGGANTTWLNSTVRLYGISAYTLNTKTTGGDVYGTLEVVSPLAVRVWNSSAATTTVLTNASLYSQDHNAIDGALTIYGNFGIATATEYWSYATDFDGTALVGLAQRQVNVRLAENATTTMLSGSLQMEGTAATSTTVAALSTGTYTMRITGGTLNAQYYSFANLDVAGLSLTGSPTITNLANGYYVLSVAGGTLIDVSASTLDANASKIFTNVGFATTTAITGINVTVNGSTSNAWRFSSSYGNLGGESFDSDGLTACGSVRFDNSGCLLTQQTHYRWRNDNGGEGIPASEWFNTSFDYRKRVRVVNTDTSAYASTAIKLAVTYDSTMQADFDDLRFTSSDGLTEIPFWIERYTASTDATVWVRVPNLPASDIATVFMYFGSSTATNVGNGNATFTAFDDFEDNNITEYAGDTTLFQTDTTPVYGGLYALEALNKNGRTTDGIFRTALTVSQGQIIRWMQYLDGTGGGDDACTLFGVQSPGTSNNNYAICLQKFGTDRLVIAKNIADNDSSGTVLASSTATFATGWYEVEVDWRTNNTITAYLRTAAGSLIATASTTDATYTTGGMGFTFWFQNGSWDSFTARSRALLTPTVYFGVRQTDGGATWEATQNTAGAGIPGNTKRLRFAIENSGLDITNQTFRLEYASKGVAPSCEAVSSGNFAAVPNQASCGTSPICMQTSTQIADNDATTDHFASTTGQFSAGTIVESPSNITSSFNVNQNNYTEIEYVLTPTVNASTAYCLRVTNAGTPLDFYNKVAELSLQFDPVFGPVTLNDGNPITLIPNATTSVFATGTVTDFNGSADIVSGSSTVYRSGAGSGCTANTNDCYKADTSASSSCARTNCSGNTCVLSCRVDLYFNADATDASSTYDGQDWQAYLEVWDGSGGYDLASAIGVELYTLRAAAVNNSINYGSLSVGSSTGAVNATTTVSNVGNVKFNLALLGTDLADSGSSRIPANKQKFATTTFDYSGCAGTVCSSLSSTTPVNLELKLAKPTVPTPPVTAPVYWGIEVPIGINSAAHQGINVFTPTYAP